MEKVTYRAVEECITRLSRIYQLHQDDLEAGLFCPDAAALRHRLKSSLVKIIFLTPVDFGAKGEELLWRKVFYEVLAQVKKRRQSGRRLTQRVEALYRCHLFAGLGFYQQLMARILIEYPPEPGGSEAATASEFGAGADGFLDFAPTVERQRLISPAEAAGGLGTASWARDAVHRCLLHIGDLYRYLREFKGEVALALVQRYYGAAARFNPRIGLPYNQLGTLDLGSYYNLTAVYYYLRCLVCEQPFEGSRRNLATILRKNQRRYEALPPLPRPQQEVGENGAGSTEHRPHKPVKQFVVRFLHLIAKLMFPQSLQQHQKQRQYQQHQLQQDAELKALCESVLASLANCLQPQHSASPPPLCVRASEVDPLRPHQLADSAVMQAALTALMCLHRLAEGNSRMGHACTAFCLGFFACVLQCAGARCRSAQSQALSAGSAANSARGAEPNDNGEQEEETTEVDNEAEFFYEEAGEGDRSRRRRRFADGDDDEEQEEEEAGGDFPGGFSAARRRRQRQAPQQRKRLSPRARRASSSSGASSSDASSDCQLAFGYGEEDEEEGGEDAGEDDVAAAEEEGGDNGVGFPEETSSVADEAASRSPGGLLASGPFCFSYGIPSALVPRESGIADLPAGDPSESPPPLLSPEPEPAVEDPPAAASEDSSLVLQLLLGRVRLLQTVKLLQDWMLCQPHLLTRAVQESCLPLWDQLALLLNLLPASPGEDCGIICPEPDEPMPALPEDLHCRGLALFRPAQRHVDFGRGLASGLARAEESRARLSALRRFGFLAVQNDQLAFEFDAGGARQFLGPTAVRRASRDGQMRNLAQMRLINQVQQLESAVAGPAFTASHAVPSRQCLTDALEQVQALVRSRRCVLVLPRSSIDHLDRLKRSSKAARSASRYLELELHSGVSLINAHEFPTLSACAKQLRPETTVFLVCKGEAPPPNLPFPARDLTEFVRQAVAAASQPASQC